MHSVYILKYTVRTWGMDTELTQESLNPEQRARDDYLRVQLNGCLPPHLDPYVFNERDLPGIIGRMKVKEVLRLNDLLPAGTQVDVRPRSIICWTKPDEWGDRCVAYRGMNYIGAAKQDAFIQISTLCMMKTDRHGSFPRYLRMSSST
jgi:hypothetical protein